MPPPSLKKKKVKSNCILQYIEYIYRDHIYNIYTLKYPTDYCALFPSSSSFTFSRCLGLFILLFLSTCAHLLFMSSSIEHYQTRAFLCFSVVLFPFASTFSLSIHLVLSILLLFPIFHFLYPFLTLFLYYSHLISSFIYSYLNFFLTPFHRLF